jgi:hypothetical protein
LYRNSDQYGVFYSNISFYFAGSNKKSSNTNQENYFTLDIVTNIFSNLLWPVSIFKFPVVNVLILLFFFFLIIGYKKLWKSFKDMERSL